MLRKNKKVFNQDTVSAGLGQRITRHVTNWEEKAASWLNAKCRSWSARRLKIVLLLFCVVTGGYCLSICINAFIRIKGPPAYSSTGKLKMPVIRRPGMTEPKPPDSNSHNKNEQSKNNNNEKPDK